MTQRVAATKRSGAAGPLVTIERISRKKGRFASGHFCRNGWFYRPGGRMVA